MSNVVGVPSQHGLEEQGLRNLNMEYWSWTTPALVERIVSRREGVLGHEGAVFGFAVSQECAGVPSAILNPRNTWKNAEAYDRQARILAGAFKENFAALSGGVSAEMAAAGPA